jgi:hypothetical protein
MLVAEDPAEWSHERGRRQRTHLIRVRANLAKRNLRELTVLVKTRLRRMQFRAGLLDGFLASTRLDLTPICNPEA